MCLKCFTIYENSNLHFEIQQLEYLVLNSNLFQYLAAFLKKNTSQPGMQI